jgi:hypothetical protein
MKNAEPQPPTIEEIKNDIAALEAEKLRSIDAMAYMQQNHSRLLGDIEAKQKQLKELIKGRDRQEKKQRGKSIIDF